MSPMLKQIISGGQTGADRGGLDGAIAAGVPHGGFCPRGRRAEDGRIPAQYNLTETKSASYPERTRQNAQGADGTVIFYNGSITPGCSRTVIEARHAKRPYILINLLQTTAEDASQRLRLWVRKKNIITLNVAGSRESKAPGVQKRVAEVVGLVLLPRRKPRRKGATV